MKILLTRHGATAGNLEKRYIGGRCDEPLFTRDGITVYPNVERVYTSGMLRTEQTAEIMYPRARQISLSGLREMDFGIFEGKNWAELSDCRDYRVWVEGGCTGRCPGGESRPEFIDRCVETFKLLLERQAGSDSGELHLVVHGGTIMALLSTLVIPMRDYFAYETPCAGQWVCRLNAGHLEILETPEHKKEKL